MKMRTQPAGQRKAAILRRTVLAAGAIASSYGIDENGGLLRFLPQPWRMYVAAIAAVIVGLGFLAYLAHEVRKDLAKRRAVRANRLGWSQHARDVERGVRSPEGERK